MRVTATLNIGVGYFLYSKVLLHVIDVAEKDILAQILIAHFRVALSLSIKVKISLIYM